MLDNAAREQKVIGGESPYHRIVTSNSKELLVSE